jgi:hypothetical protein
MKKQTTCSTANSAAKTSTGVSGAPKRGRGAAKKNLNSDALKTSALENNPKVLEETSSVNALKNLYQTLYDEFSRLAEDAHQKLQQVEALESSLGQSAGLNLRFPSPENPAIATSESNSVSSSSSNKSNRSHSIKTADCRGHIIRSRIIGKAFKLVGNHETAKNWYDSQLIKSLDNKTPKQLVAEGSAKAVLMHLEVLEDGGYS